MLEINGKSYLTVKEAARITGYAATYITTLIRKGRLPAIKLGMSWGVEAGALERYRAANPLRKPRTISEE